MLYAQHTAWPPVCDQTHCAQSGMIWARVLHCAHRRWSNTVQPDRSVFPGRWSYPMQQCCQQGIPWWYRPCESKFQRVNLGLPEAVTTLSNIGNQLECWLCVAKKPAFMLIHEFVQWQTQLFIFSYINDGYLHQIMELPIAQEKSKQIFLPHLKAHQYKFRDNQDCSATLTTPKVKNIKTIMALIHLIMQIHMSHFASLFLMRN